MSALRWPEWTRFIKQGGLLLMALLLVAACNRNAATPTPMPATPTQPPVATATVAATVATATVAANVTTSPPTFDADAPTPTPVDAAPGSAIGIAAQGAIFTSPRYSYTVVLPCCWLALPTAGTAIESALAELEGDNALPIWGEMGEEVGSPDQATVLELVALLPDAENTALPVAQMTVSVLPSYGLTLDDYLAGTTDELTRIANTTVITSYIEPTLGVGTFPAAVIEYTAVPSPATDNNAEQSMAGLQIAFFGHDADTLIVVTFTTTQDRIDALTPEFLHIVRGITLDDPAV